jgi:hypothetical protein
MMTGPIFIKVFSLQSSQFAKFLDHGIMICSFFKIQNTKLKTLKTFINNEVLYIILMLGGRLDSTPPPLVPVRRNPHTNEDES